MKKCIVIGASGYSGGMLCQLLLAHPKFELVGVAVSDGSVFSGQKFAEQFPQHAYDSTLCFVELSQLKHSHLWQDADVFFLATPHELSAALAAELYVDGKQVFDLSGAYRLKSAEQFAQFYGFSHPHPELLAESVYGLVELNRDALPGAQLIAVAGCYPTASALGLAPLIRTHKLVGKPIINAVSGVSGAGRKASLANSFCEVSLQAYGIGEHRHKPEIEQTLNHSVVFTPHLGNFKQGILATITLLLGEPTTQVQVDEQLIEFYRHELFIKVTAELPAIHHVVNTPYAQLSARVFDDGASLQLFVAIDNLMKGAASQAIQCANLANGWCDTLGLLPAIPSLPEF